MTTGGRGAEEGQLFAILLVNDQHFKVTENNNVSIRYIFMFLEGRKIFFYRSMVSKFNIIKNY